MVRQSKQNRFLKERNGIYYYWRRVPRALGSIDSRAPFIRASLKTDDLALARAKRDILEKADKELWSSMLLEGTESDRATAAYQAARLRCEAWGFSYKPAEEIARMPIEGIVERVSSIMDARTVEADTAVLGGAEEPKVEVSKAFDIYCDEIVADEVAGKSPAQYKQWKKVKKRSVDSFIKVVGDLAMTGITREHGRTFYKHWLDKVVRKDGGKRKSASPGNRMVGNMRVLSLA